jgi:hypothetical protein
VTKVNTARNEGENEEPTALDMACAYVDKGEANDGHKY